MHQPIGGRLTLGACAALAAAAIVGCGSSGGGSGGGGSGAAGGTGHGTPVTVQLDYQPRGDHAMFYVGVKKGFFARNGIDVTKINIGTGSPDAMRSVGKGQSDFAFGDLPTMATAVAQGVPDVSLVAVNERSPMSLCSLTNKLALHRPQDLEGHTMGIDYKGSTFIFYKSLLAANGMSRSSVKERPVTEPYENFLLTGRVDAITCYVDAELPVVEAGAKSHHLGPVSVVLGADYGYNVLGSGLVTSRKMIQDKPGVVRRFVKGYMEAYRWVIAHPSQAAQIVAQSSPLTKNDAPTFTQQLEADIHDTFTSPVTKAHGLGYNDPREWRSTVDTLVKQKTIPKAPATSSLYDNSFVRAADRGSGGA